MMQIGAGEFIVIVVLALVVLGPERLPNAARYVGQLVGSVRDMATSFQTEIDRASDGFIENQARQKGQLQVDQERQSRAAVLNELAAAKDGSPDEDGSPAEDGAPDEIGSHEKTASTENSSSGDPSSAQLDEPPADTAEAGSETASATGSHATGVTSPEPLAPIEPDRTEKPHSASMYEVEPDARNAVEPDAGNKVESDAGNKVEPDAGNKVEPDARNAVESDTGAATSQLEADLAMLATGYTADSGGTDHTNEPDEPSTDAGQTNHASVNESATRSTTLGGDD